MKSLHFFAHEAIPCIRAVYTINWVFVKDADITGKTLAGRQNLGTKGANLGVNFLDERPSNAFQNTAINSMR